MSAKPAYQYAQETAWPLLVFELNEIRPVCGSAWRRMLQVGEAGDELSGVTAAVGMMSANELTAGRAVLLLGVHPLTSPSNLRSLNLTAHVQCGSVTEARLLAERALSFTPG